MVWGYSVLMRQYIKVTVDKKEENFLNLILNILRVVSRFLFCKRNLWIKKDNILHSSFIKQQNKEKSISWSSSHE